MKNINVRFVKGASDHRTNLKILYHSSMEISYKRFSELWNEHIRTHYIVKGIFQWAISRNYIPYWCAGNVNKTICTHANCVTHNTHKFIETYIIIAHFEIGLHMFRFFAHVLISNVVRILFLFSFNFFWNSLCIYSMFWLIAYITWRMHVMTHTNSSVVKTPHNT